MATLYTKSVSFLKLAWVQQPVLFVSTVIGALGKMQYPLLYVVIIFNCNLMRCVCDNMYNFMDMLFMYYSNLYL